MKDLECTSMKMNNTLRPITLHNGCESIIVQTDMSRYMGTVVLIALSSSEHSGESAHMRMPRLDRAFAAHIHQLSMLLKT